MEFKIYHTDTLWKTILFFFDSSNKVVKPKVEY